MRFAREIWLYAVPLVPVLWLVLRLQDRRSRVGLRRLLGEQGPAHIEGDHPRLRSWSRFLLLAGVFWLLLALARPQWGASEVTVTQRGSDIVVALDISNSMLAQDVLPDRLSRAKGELDAFFDRLTDSRVGLVFFAGSAFIQCPLTLDYPTARIFLDMAGPDMLSEQGTAIAAALKTARELLTRGRGDQPPGFQAILLVTDGEDLEGDWEEAAKQCLDDGIRIIPVGVGSPEGGLIPVTDDKGQPAGFMKDQDGSVVMSRLDMAALQKLAAMGGGNAFRIGVDGMAGDRLFAELARLGKRDLEDRRISAYKERYLWPLLLALVCFWVRCLLLAGLGGLHRRSTVPIGAVLLLMLCFAGRPVTAGVVTPQAEAMARGRQDYLEQDYQSALSEFGAALVHDPDDPRISLALGETLSRLRKYDDAVREFERTLELTDDPVLRAEALYNSGTTLLAAGKLPQAVDKLQASLSLDPGQQDALTNLERALAMLRQQQQQQKKQKQKDREQKDRQDQKDRQQQDKQKQNEQQQKNQTDQQQKPQQGDRPQKEQQQKEQQQKEQERQQERQQEQQGRQAQKSQPNDDQDQKDSRARMDREHALQVLKALDRDEQELKRSVQKRLKGGKPRSGKRW